MLALPFELFGFTQYIENEPPMMVFVATFGLLPVLFIMAPFMRLPFLKSLLGIIGGGLVLVLFPGFIMTMIFAFSGVSGVHTLLSWIVLVIASILFVAFNYSRIMLFAKDLSARIEEKPKSPKRTRQKKESMKEQTKEKGRRRRSKKTPS